ncbi:hypothetical protein [Piscinibacter koreensis]|uniref:Uncharacterized protein n=1 Tax=Piscinibacter koreensis TaxID=2742824 RepID=A0A7Y6NSF2_9BURK|nr:hypothetical protein [Schlegelella koreensis]NUZ08487.1 hypothetical protein [Schlegelella koreensis]
MHELQMPQPRIVQFRAGEREGLNRRLPLARLSERLGVPEADVIARIFRSGGVDEHWLFCA